MSLEDDESKQRDELDVLKSIYDTEWHAENESNRDFSIKIYGNDDEKQNLVFMQIHLPENYPSQSPPHYELMAPWMTREDKRKLEAKLADIYCENLGESILYMWIEGVREFLQDSSQSKDTGSPTQEADTHTGDDDDLDDIDWSAIDFSSQSNASTGEQPDTDADFELPPIYHGDTIIDRKSVFQPHLAPIVHRKQIQQVFNNLCENKKIAHATHNIMAYRICEGDNLYQGCDDDGETHAGSRMLHLMNILDVRNVMVVVSRWYGGILLGADRFKHINNAARSILQQQGYIDQETKKTHKGKKKK